MAEETALTEQEAAEQVAAEEAPAEQEEKRNGSGPGFILGVVVGALAGAAAATLFAPATGEELHQGMGEEAGPFPRREEGETGAEGSEPATAVARMRAIVARVRSRVREASVEGHEAVSEAEEQYRARYSELTQPEHRGE